LQGSRQAPGVVSVGVQDPVILHSEDDNMQHIVIIGRFAELMPTLAIQPSLCISMPKAAHLGREIAISKPCRESLSDQPSKLPKKYAIKIMQTY
jgi:hypothetical protein